MRRETIMDRTFYELREVLSRPGCPICKLERDAERRYLDTLFYELVNDYEVRERVLRSGGFCSAHTALIFEERNSVLGIAIIYRDLLAHFFDGKPIPLDCPLCTVREEKEQHLLTILEKRWTELESYWGERTFLCQHHFRKIPENGKLYSELKTRTQKSLNAIQQHLSGLIDKFDYRKARLPLTPGEELSWQEALEFFAGKTLKKGK